MACTNTARSEAGVSLTEVLVVVVIVGILAGIALPLLLRQREEAYAATVQSDLTNAAIVMESHHAEHEEYSSAALTGLRPSQGVTLSLENEGESYCLLAVHANVADETWAWDSANGGQQGRGSSC